MGKKNSTFKNIMVTLGCAGFAGVVVLGGGHIASSYISGESVKPAWFDRVEIRVGEADSTTSASNTDSADANSAGIDSDADADANSGTNAEAYKGSADNDSGVENQNVPSGEDNVNQGADNGRNDSPGPDSGSDLQQPRFKEEESSEQEDDQDTETQTESQTETQETETESLTEEGKDNKANKTDKNDKTEKTEKERTPVQVKHVQVIQQEGLSHAIVADVTAVVKEAMPSLVSITNEYTAYDYWYDEEYDEEANGSGIIVAQTDEELLIATNYHVVENNNSLYVQFNDDKKAVAYVKGQSPENDLAVVSVFLDDVSDETLESIAIAALGDSDSLQVGEPAIAIGDSLGYGQSVTTGVISALNRDIFADNPDINQGYLIQTDAAINPGNSGGALLNANGEVIGINSSKIADYVIEGMGYAIPISTARPIIDDLMKEETRRKVAEEDRAFLGVAGTDVTEEANVRYEMPEGVYVNNVLEGTAADKAGILKGDIITYIDGQKLTRMEQLQDVLEYYAAGTEVELVLMRQKDGEYEQRTVTVTLGARED